MNIATDIQDDFAEKLVTTWEASVRATHDFLGEEDIAFFRPLVRQAVKEVGPVYYLTGEEDSVAGLMAVVDEKIEMLFLHPACRGRGLGRQFVTYALESLRARFVDVNEQNPQAVGFYQHMGFVVTGRSALDSTGKPFPILYMEWRGKGEGRAQGKSVLKCA